MKPITRKQREALYKVWKRDTKLSYRQFRRTAVQGYDCLMVPYAGMWLGIELDGYTHS
jgi:hypothetical protein